MFSDLTMAPSEIDRAINRLARLGIGLCCALLLAGGAALIWQIGNQQRFAAWAITIVPDLPVTITGESWAAGAATVVAVYLILCWTMIQTIGLFRSLATGDRFGGVIERRLYQLGWAVMWLAIGSVIGRTALYLSLTWFNPAGQRRILIAFEGRDAGAIITGILLLLLAKLMLLASMADEERRGFI